MTMNSLPREVKEIILTKLDIHQLLVASCVCKVRDGFVISRFERNVTLMCPAMEQTVEKRSVMGILSATVES